MIEILVTTCARAGNDPGFWRTMLADQMAVAERTIANLIASGQADYPISINIEDAGIEDRGLRGRYCDAKITIRTRRIEP